MKRGCIRGTGCREWVDLNPAEQRKFLGLQALVLLRQFVGRQKLAKKKGT